MSKSKVAKYGRLVTVYIRLNQLIPLQQGAKDVEFSYQSSENMIQPVDIEKHRLHRDPKTRKLLIKLS